MSKQSSAALKTSFDCGQVPALSAWQNLIDSMWANVLCGAGAPSAAPADTTQAALYVNSTTGAVYFYCGSSWTAIAGSIPVTVSNGLNDADVSGSFVAVELGGTLTKHTTVDQDGFTIYWTDPDAAFVIGAGAAGNNARFTVVGPAAFGANDHGSMGANAAVFGSDNMAFGDRSFVTGSGNTVNISADDGFAIGGSDNTVSGSGLYGGILGGYDNTVNSAFSSAMIVGGHSNSNQAGGFASMILGGHDNVITNTAGESSMILNGNENTLSATGTHNTIIGSGTGAITNGSSLSVGMAFNGSISDSFLSAIIAAQNSTMQGANRSLIGSSNLSSITNTDNSAFNTILSSESSTITQGGYSMMLGSPNSFIAGGGIHNSVIGSSYSGVQGGNNNSVLNSYFSAVRSTGSQNTIIGSAGVVTELVIAAGSGSTIIGSLTASGMPVTVSGAGSHGTIIGSYPGNTISAVNGMSLRGGQGNTGVQGLINAANGFAVGFGVVIASGHDSAFLFNTSETSGLTSTVAREFAIKAPGGFRLYSNDAADQGVTMSAGVSGWTNVSDSALKKVKGVVDGNAILALMSSVPVSRYTMVVEETVITRQKKERPAKRSLERAPLTSGATLAETLAYYGEPKENAFEIEEPESYALSKERRDGPTNIGIMADTYNVVFADILDAKKIDNLHAISQSDVNGILWAAVQALYQRVVALGG